MKKLIFSSLCFVMIFSVNAQEKEQNAFKSSYALKWNPSGIYFGKLALQGEYNFKMKKSFTLNVGVPMSKSISVKMDDKDRNLDIKTFSLMGGYRMYLGKKTMTGIYFEPYLKYVKNDASAIISGDLDGSEVDFLTSSSYSATGVGGQLGVQFMIAKRVTFDFFFLGPEANSTKHKVTMKDLTSSSWDSNDAADAEKEINDNIGDVPVIGKKLKVTVDANNKIVSSEYKGFLPGVRFGLSLGFHF